MVPIGWYFLFKPEDVIQRGQEFPRSLEEFDKDDSLDSLEEFLEEPVAMKISLPDAKSRLAQFRKVFEPIPYIWSYFKVIDILDVELEKYITQLQDKPSPVRSVERRGPHPETKLSQVKLQNDATEIVEDDNPFAALEQLGASGNASQPLDKVSVKSSDLDDLSDNDLLAALEEAAALDFSDEERTEELVDFEPEVEEDGLFMHVTIYFNNIS
jgi:hypothetical protein